MLSYARTLEPRLRQYVDIVPEQLRSVRFSAAQPGAGEKNDDKHIH